MAEYAPLRDAFQELNRLLIDKQQWDAKHELDKENQGIQRMQVESQLQDAALRRKGLEKQAKIDSAAMEVVPVNIYNFVPNSKYSQDKLFDKTDAGLRFAQAIGGPGTTVDRATGMAKDANGDLVRMPSFLVSTKAAAAFGIAAEAFDPEEMINENLNVANIKIKELEKSLDDTPVVNVAERKRLREKLSEAKTVLNQHTKMLEPEQLEIMYRQKVKMLDNLSLKAAADGAEASVLQQAQNAAQRANVDLLNIQNRIFQKQSKDTEIQFRKEDRAEARQARKEERELDRAARLSEKQLALEAARIKGAGEKTQQHYAVKVDKDGNVVDSVLVNTPKTGVASMTPEELDPRLKGFSWSKQEEMIQSGSKGRNKLEIGTINTMAQQAWETIDPSDPLGKKKWIVPADVPRRDATRIVMARDWGKKNSMQTLVDAQREVLSSEAAFMEDVDLRASKEAAKRGLVALPKQDLDKLIELMAHEKDGFYGDYGYVPKFEHRKSLDRSFPGSIGLPKEED